MAPDSRSQCRADVTAACGQSRAAAAPGSVAAAAVSRYPFNSATGTPATRHTPRGSAAVTMTSRWHARSCAGRERRGGVRPEAAACFVLAIKAGGRPHAALPRRLMPFRDEALREPDIPAAEHPPASPAAARSEAVSHTSGDTPCSNRIHPTSRPWPCLRLSCSVHKLPGNIPTSLRVPNQPSSFLLLSRVTS